MIYDLLKNPRNGLSLKISIILYNFTDDIQPRCVFYSIVIRSHAGTSRDSWTTFKLLKFNLSIFILLIEHLLYYIFYVYCVSSEH